MAQHLREIHDLTVYHEKCFQETIILWALIRDRKSRKLVKTDFHDFLDTKIWSYSSYDNVLRVVYIRKCTVAH